MGWEVFLPDRSIKPVENKIHEIAGSVETCIPVNGGLMGGAAGLACFCAHYAGHTGIQRFALLAADLLEQALGPAPGSFPGYSFADGLSGTAWMIHHLQETQMPWLEVEGVFEYLDQTIADAMMHEMKAGNYDYLHAALGMALYYLREPENTLYRQLLSKLTNELYLKAEIESEGAMKWCSLLDQENDHYGYNLSLSHGLASILIILNRIRAAGIEAELCEQMISGGVLYIKQQRLEKNAFLSIFPSWGLESSSEMRHSRLAWCYGDIGIGMAFLEVGRYEKWGECYRQGIEILKHTTGRHDPLENHVMDAGLCHGSAGLAMIYNYMYQETASDSFKEAAIHWLDVCLKMDVHTDAPAGYKAMFPDDMGGWQNSYGMLDGVAGIGLVLLSFISCDQPDWMKSMLLF